MTGNALRIVSGAGVRTGHAGLRWCAAALLVAVAQSCFAGPVARVMRMKPVATVTPSGSQRAVALKERSRLSFGDRVSVSGAGELRLEFSSDAKMLCCAPTEFTLSRPESPEESVILDVARRLSKIVVDQPRSTVKVRTPAATAAAIGTTFAVRITQEAVTVVTVLHGTVRFYNDRGSVLVQANQASTAEVGEAPTPAVAVDASGLLEWTADLTTLPVEFETPLATTRVTPDALRRLKDAAVSAGAGATQHEAYGQALYELGQWSDAVDQFDAAARLAPDKAGPHLGLGHARRCQGDGAAALAAYERARALAPSDPRPTIGMALVLLAKGDTVGAIAALAPVAETAPGLAVRGLVELRSGRGVEAEALLRKSVSAERGLASAHALLALAMLQNGDAPGSVSEARDAVRLAPASAQARGTLAMSLFFAGRTQEAGREAAIAARLDPLSPFALVTQARTLLAQRRAGDALRVCRQARSLAPSLAVVHAELGTALAQLGRFADAEPAFRQAFALAPRMAAASIGLAAALQRQGKYAEAADAYRAALQARPGESSALQGLASLLVEQGDLAGAERLLADPVVDRPERAALLIRASEAALIRRADLGLAEAYADRAVRLLPLSGVARYQLGRVFWEQGRLAQAEHHLRLALVLDPRLSDARYALGVLRSQVDQGRPTMPALFTGDTGSLARMISLMNLGAPGLSDRVQAVSIDPGVVRPTSHAYGSTQLDLTGGSNDSWSAGLAHLTPTPAVGGVSGVTVTHEETAGFRVNGDSSTERASIFAGQPASGGRAGLFALGQFASRARGLNGLDVGGFPARDLGADETGWHWVPGLGLTARERTNTPLGVVGATVAPHDRFRTRLLVQFSRPSMSLVGLQEGSTASQEMDNRAVEVRSDVGLGARNTLSVGAAVGTSRFLQQQVLPVGPFSLQTTDARTRSLLVYARDEAELGRLTLAAEGQFQRGRSAAQYAWWGAEEAGAPAMSFDDRIARQLWRTKLLASYRAGSGCEVRFRARGMFGSIPDFQLLAPSDEFHDPGAGMPELDLVGTGDGYDLELLRTVGGLGFVRASLAYQQLRAVRDDIQMRYERATLLCPRLTLEGRAGRHTTFYVEGGYNDASVEADGARMPMPDASRWFGAVGFSYDGPAGWFMAPTVSVRGAVPPKQVAAPVNGELAVVEQRLPGYWLANIRFGRRFGLRGVAFVDVLNAFDRRYDRYETGLTQVGRVVRAGVTSRF